MPDKDIHTKIYDLEYFSGSQMFLYIGDVWVDEVTSLSYQTIQRKGPIYGYASQLWDDVAAGPVIVQGNFTINFKEQGYLWAVLRRFKTMFSEEVGFTTQGDKKLLEARRRDPGIYKDQEMSSISRASIERISYGDATKGDRFKFYHDLAGYSTFKHGSPKDRTFENIAETFEDQIWDRKLENSDLNAQIRRTDDNMFDGFDMYVVFGNYSDNRANHTVQKIIDVRLMSQGKQIVIDGSPVQESYMFIARSVA